VGVRVVAGVPEGGVRAVSGAGAGVGRMRPCQNGVGTRGSEPDPLGLLLSFGGPSQTPYAHVSALGVRARPPLPILRLWGSEPDPLV
jgi:hypothetical protein